MLRAQVLFPCNLIAHITVLAREQLAIAGGQ